MELKLNPLWEDLSAQVSTVMQDKQRIGTPDYQGEAIFWADEFDKYGELSLLETDPQTRRRIHGELLSAGLLPSEASEEHLTVIRATIGSLRRNVQAPAGELAHVALS